ncbi:MAG: polysaccharide deacetylase family protein [Pseudomonadota bacterium]
MRISIAFAGIALACGLITNLPTAEAGSGKLGTHRVIKVDTSKYREFRGKEKALGLRHKEVILTFDDGPIAGKTPRILDTLKREGVKATFFYVGRMARAYPKLVRRVVREGHTLAHHTWGHNRLPKYSTASARKHIDRGIARLQKIAYGDASTTPRIPFFRYPYLARNKRTDGIIRAKRMVAFGANIDALDWKRWSPDRVHNHIMRRLRAEGRGIILMHDIQARTAKMLPRLLRSLKREGYKVVHMVPKGTPAPKIDKPVETLVVASAKPDKKLPMIAKTEAPPVRESEQVVRAAMAEAEAMQVKATATLNQAKAQKPRRVKMAFNLARAEGPSPREVAERKRRERAQLLQATLRQSQEPRGTDPVEVASLAPAVIKSVNEATLRPQKTRKKKTRRLKVVAGKEKRSSVKRSRKAKAKTRRSALAKSIVKRGAWKLRRSQWIIN